MSKKPKKKKVETPFRLRTIETEKVKFVSRYTRDGDMSREEISGVNVTEKFLQATNGYAIATTPQQESPKGHLLDYIGDHLKFNYIPPANRPIDVELIQKKFDYKKGIATVIEGVEDHWTRVRADAILQVGMVKDFFVGLPNDASVRIIISETDSAVVFMSADDLGGNQRHAIIMPKHYASQDKILYDPYDMESGPNVISKTSNESLDPLHLANTKVKKLEAHIDSLEKTIADFLEEATGRFEGLSSEVQALMPEEPGA